MSQSLPVRGHDAGLYELKDAIGGDRIIGGPALLGFGVRPA
ncbi:hypothetical protein [Amycolatopsis orientalis]